MTIKVNLAAIEALKTDPKVLADLKRRADAIKAKCGEGYESAVDAGSNPHAAVYTYTAKAMRSNAKHNTLIKNLDAGRD